MSRYFGVDYYPEHWPRERWEEDARLMEKMGIGLVRMAEFAWAHLEPAAGIYDFDWLDEAIATLARHNIRTILGTPTAAPPAWLIQMYPESLPMDKSGVRQSFGGRHHCCHSNPALRRRIRLLVTAMAKHYGQCKDVTGWQIDNELNCETNEFYSAADSVAFRLFLKEKYDTLEALNEAWGTVFWNQSYTNWEEIYVPRTTLNMGINPHQHLDYYRFLSDSTLKYCGMQAEIIKKYKKPGDYIMTNGMFWNVDNHRMEKDCLDVYTYDSYPSFAFGLDRNPKVADDLNDRKWTMHLNEVRSICPHFGIMEQQSGANGWTTRMEGPAPRPGQLTLWAMQSVAQGADFISFFRWRTCTVGSEIYWHGILDYDNRDNRKLAEVKEFYQKFKSIDAVCGAKNMAAFALIKDYDNEWDTEVDVWHRKVAEKSEKETFIASELYHTPYDIVYLQEDSELSDLTEYPAAIYPHPVIMDERRARLLREYVEQGGVLVIGCRSGYKDMNGRCVMMPQPGFL